MTLPEVTKTLEKGKHINDCGNRTPAINVNYNHNKGGLDLDKVTGIYSCRSNPSKPMWMPDKLKKRRVFLELLGKGPITPYFQRRKHLLHSAASAAIMKVFSGGWIYC